MGYAVGVGIGNRDSAFIIPSKSYEGVKWFLGTCSVKRLLLRKIYLKLNAQGVLLPKKIKSPKSKCIPYKITGVRKNIPK